MTPQTFTALHIIPTGCGVCGGSLHGTLLGCERCGVEIHDGCYLTAVASSVEVARLMTTGSDVAILCRGCRS